jgi:hypothetical protein
MCVPGSQLPRDGCCIASGGELQPLRSLKGPRWSFRTAAFLASRVPAEGKGGQQPQEERI